MYYSLISSMSKISDAEKFIQAAQITDNTQKLAINNLVDDLKLYGLWSKMKAIYPFVGANAFSHKFNLKDPRDLNAAFRLTFNGGGTHSLTGYLPNGTNAYAESYVNPYLTLTQPFIGYYSRTNANTATDQIDIGAILGVGLWISAWYNSSGLSNFIGRNSSNAVLLVGPAITDSRAWFWTNKIVNTAKLGINSSIVNSSSDTALPPNINIYVGANNYNNLPGGYTNRECAFSLIADGLTDTDTSNLYISIQKFQQTLGRHIGVPTVSDADAQAFLNAANINDITQANAINTLVISLKSYDLWTKMKAIYPFVGGTSFTHKFNLKDPRNLDAAFRLGFYGGANHNANGIQFNGTNGGAFTYFNPFLIQAKSNLHLSIYTRVRPTRYIYAADIYNQTSYTPIGWTVLQATSNSPNYELFSTSDSASGAAVLNNTTSIGFSIGSRTSSTLIKYYKNNLSVAGNGAVNNDNFQNSTLTINGNTTQGNNSYSAGQYAFSSIGNGLTDAEAAIFYTIVQTYQTNLGRQV